GQHLLVAGHHDVAAQHQLGTVGRDADGVDVFGLLRDAQVAVDGAALLRETGLIDDADALAFEVRGHAENPADGHDAGTADAGDDDVVGAVDRRQRRLRQAALLGARGNTRALLRLGAVHGDEGGTKTFDAGEILIAARLVDGALAAELGFERLHRDAVRDDAAVAAAFADQLVDDHPLVGIGISAALAPATFLGGAGLVIDQHGDAGNFGELGLHCHQLVAVMNGEPLRPILVVGIFVGLVGDHDHALDAFRRHLAGD